MSLTYKHPIIPRAYMLESHHEWDGVIQTFYPNCMPQLVAEDLHRTQVSKEIVDPLPGYIIRRADDCPF